MNCLRTVPIDGVLTTEKRQVMYMNDVENMMDLPIPGEWIAVEVSSVISPTMFYVIFPYGSRPAKTLRHNMGNCTVYILYNWTNSHTRAHTRTL